MYGLGFVVMRESHPLTPALSPRGGEGEREPIFIVFEIAFTLDISGRCNPNNQLGQFPRPLGGKGADRVLFRT
jgi:hypothetical protein